jgi:hypothetical protein
MAPPLETLESVRSASGQARTEGLRVSAIFDLMAAGLIPLFAESQTGVAPLGYVEANGSVREPRSRGSYGSCLRI